MFRVVVFALLAITNEFKTEAKFILVGDGIVECDNGAPMASVDFSNFDLISREEDGEMLYNGSITFLKDFNSPWKVKITSKRFERGSWQPGIISKEIRNLCVAIANPMESIVYQFTREFKQKSCPIKAGHKEVFDMLKVGSYGLAIPPDFAGEWKFYTDFWVPRNGAIQHECYLLLANVYEA